MATGWRVILDLNNGLDRNIGIKYETLGEAKARLLEDLSRPALQYSVFAVKEAKQATQDRAQSYLVAMTKVYDLKVGEHLPLQNNHFYFIEEVEMKD